MGYDFAAFRQDLEAALNALEDEDFAEVNIFANRIMSNSIVGSDRKLALPGFLLKDVAFVFGNLRARAPTTAFSTAKAMISAYGKTLKKKTETPDFKEGELWQDYYELTRKSRHLGLDTYERDAYVKPNVAFTHEYFLWLISYLGSNKEILLNPKSRFLKGLLNELGRLQRSHGGGITETYSISLITALDWCYESVKNASSAESDFKTQVSSEILPYVDKVVTTLKEGTPDEEQVNQILWELIRKWRENFIKFMEPPRVTVSPIYGAEKGIRLPEETRKKLTENITRSLEKEVRPKE